jgi:hypothetical protein
VYRTKLSELYGLDRAEIWDPVKKLSQISDPDPRVKKYRIPGILDPDPGVLKRLPKV